MLQQSEVLSLGPAVTELHSRLSDQPSILFAANSLPGLQELRVHDVVPSFVSLPLGKVHCVGLTHEDLAQTLKQLESKKLRTASLKPTGHLRSQNRKLFGMASSRDFERLGTNLFQTEFLHTIALSKLNSTFKESLKKPCNSGTATWNSFQRGLETDSQLNETRTRQDALPPLRSQHFRNQRRAASRCSTP